MNKETSIMHDIQIALSATGARVFRNTVGLFYTKDLIAVRVGLCNGSSDLIGWTPVIVTSAMVGKKIAVFTAVEVKQGNGKPSPEQRQFIEVVQNQGGIAFVAYDTVEAIETLRSSACNPGTK